MRNTTGFFPKRIDTWVDSRLHGLGAAKPCTLRRQAVIASARLACALHGQRTASERGARTRSWT